MKLGRYNYNRCTVRMPCPVCGRIKYCMVSDNGERVLCTKVEHGAIKTYKCGFIHDVTSAMTSPIKVVKSKLYKPNFAHIRSVYKGLNFSSQALLPLARHLKVSVYSLRCLGVGKSDRAWDFPMYDAKRQMIGIKRRNLQEKKWCVRHSRLGVYLPSTFVTSSAVIICEGESDTAAMLDLGYNVVGRASASTCQFILCKLLGTCRAVIIADRDKDSLGLKEAYKLSRTLQGEATVIMPLVECKDAREWAENNEHLKEAIECRI